MNYEGFEHEKETLPVENPEHALEQTERLEKAEKILASCASGDVDQLVAFATSRHGLVSDELRQKAWPLLLGQEPSGENLEKGTNLIDWQLLQTHRDEEQVKLDVDRSFIYYPSHESPKALDRRKIELSNVITEVLRRYPMLCYFQGYHDIVQVMLLVLGPEISRPSTARLSLLRIRDFMLPNLSPALSQLELLPAILSAVDPKLFGVLSQIRPFFALAPILTLYAHDIQEYGAIARLFDVILAREAVFSVYIFAQIILGRKPELLLIDPSDTDLLHFTLTKLPQPLDIESIIEKSINTFNSHPPESLGPAWSRISKYSVLKTARLPAQTSCNQTNNSGIIAFEKHSAQLQRIKQAKWLMTIVLRYRRPAAGLIMAVLAGGLAVWMARSERGLWGFHKIKVLIQSSIGLAVA
ncbi:MAG: hypothetical protein M1829_002202 [Trizodia sp. TS-e1964]|nr:MAG: hypothetical protein M1829_002202 [Trizodia sp. TS-e1964]